ncbi:MAG: FAD-binding oxidoreductase [Myxococcales bacterium]|nr:FAD-binding oxidoreductase [Myxococcales bacterium]
MVDPRGSLVSAAQADLIDRLGRERVALGEAARRLAGFDPAARDGPLAVVRPNSAEQVEHVLKTGRLRRVPVEVRSRLPALFPDDLKDVLVLDTTGLQRPPSIDIGRRVVTVGAGVDVALVDRAARQARLCLRGVPAVLTGETVGAVLAAGDPGEIGIGEGAFSEDLVSALVVTGGGRTLRLGGADLLGLPPGLRGGAADPLGLLVASEGRMAVLIECTVRLQRAPFAAWGGAELWSGRPALLAALSAARAALSERVVDTVLVRESDVGVSVHLRAVSWRDEADVKIAGGRATALFKSHGVDLRPFRAEDRRVRLGHVPGEWPRPAIAAQPARLDLKVAWTDMPALLDVSDALFAEAETPPHRTWAAGPDYLRVSLDLGDQRPDVHPLIVRGGSLVEAGGLPIGPGARLRRSVQDRTTPGAKVLLQGLGRAFDPEGVLAVRGAAFGSVA